MKILWMNPHLDPENDLARELSSRGLGVLVCSNPEDAWQLLQAHGRTVDLAIIHREGARGSDEGLELINRVKADPSQSDLPILLTSEKWGDTQFTQHQSSSSGVNAYLGWPITKDDLINVIQSIFPGESLEQGSPGARETGTVSLVSNVTTGRPLKGAEEGLSFAPPPPSPPVFTTAEEAEAPTTAFEVPAPEAVAPTTSVSLIIPPTIDMPADVPVEALEEVSSKPIASPPPAEPGQLTIHFELEAPSAGGPPPVAGESTRESPSLMEAIPPPLPPSSQATSVDLVAPSALDPLERSGPVLDWKTPAPDDAISLSVGPSLAVDSSPLPHQEAQDAEEELPQVDEKEIAAEMPYLFSGSNSDQAAPGPGAPLSPSAAFSLAQPIGDAVVPGGAANSPDAETLKKYLLLREQDVAVLSSQLHTAHEQVNSLEQTLKVERARNAELTLLLEQQKQRIADFEQEKLRLEESFQGDIADLKFQLKAKTDKARQMEQQVRDATSEVERIRERVRTDFRKVRAREKDLENRLEIVKKDSEALIAARESKIIELKRKVDLLEFNMDLLQDQLSREKELTFELRERLAKAAQVVRVAGGLLDSQAAAELAQAVEGGHELKSGEKPGFKVDKKAS